MKRLIKLSIWTMVVLCIALNFEANRKNQVTITVQNATAQPISNIQVLHTGIAFETGPLSPGESKSFKFEPKNEGGYSLVIHLLKDKTVYQRCLEAYNEFERSFGQTG